jgi:hypothetical protein
MRILIAVSKAEAACQWRAAFGDPGLISYRIFPAVRRASMGLRVAGSDWDWIPLQLTLVNG